MSGTMHVQTSRLACISHLKYFPCFSLQHLNLAGGTLHELRPDRNSPESVLCSRALLTLMFSRVALQRRLRLQSGVTYLLSSEHQLSAEVMSYPCSSSFKCLPCMSVGPDMVWRKLPTRICFHSSAIHSSRSVCIALHLSNDLPGSLAQFHPQDSCSGPLISSQSPPISFSRSRSVNDGQGL